MQSNMREITFKPDFESWRAVARQLLKQSVAPAEVRLADCEQESSLWIADFVTAEIKAAVFGLIAVLIAAYQGLNAKRGPTGVGEAVNQSVVVTGIVLFAVNLVITEIFFAVVPQRTF